MYFVNVKFDKCAVCHKEGYGVSINDINLCWTCIENLLKQKKPRHKNISISASINSRGGIR